MNSVAAHLDQVFNENPSHEGHTLAELSAASPLVLVFLRHLGCSFCRQTLADLRAARRGLADMGVGIAVVHMAFDREAERLFDRYGLADVPRFSDPERRFYRAFGLRNGQYRNLWAPRVLAQGLRAAVRHGGGKPRGNLFQMPGVFLVDQGRVVAGNQLFTAAERPNYVDLVARNLSLRVSRERALETRLGASPSLAAAHS